MKKRVWLLTHGEYSDYVVDAAFSTEALAEEAREKSGGMVEEYVLYDAVPSRVTIHTVEQWRRQGGSVKERQNTAYPWQHFSRITRVHVQADTKDWLRVEGTDLEAVRQTFRDREARRKAREEGVG